MKPFKPYFIDNTDLYLSAFISIPTLLILYMAIGLHIPYPDNWGIILAICMLFLSCISICELIYRKINRPLYAAAYKEYLIKKYENELINNDSNVEREIYYKGIQRLNNGDKPENVDEYVRRAIFNWNN